MLENFENIIDNGHVQVEDGLPKEDVVKQLTTLLIVVLIHRERKHLMIRRRPVTHQLTVCLDFRPIAMAV